MKLEKDWELFKKDIEDYVLNIQNLILDYSKSKTQSEYDELDKN